MSNEKTYEQWLDAVRQNGWALQFVPETFKTAELCLAAVKQSGLALKFVPEALITPEICMTAVQQDGWALEYVSEALMTPKICLAAVGQNGLALCDVPDSLLTPKICLAAVQQNGLALQHAHKSLITPELCLAAVEQNGLALQHVPINLRTKALCQIAVAQDIRAAPHVPHQIGWALQYVPEPLRTPELCKLAVSNCGAALLYVPDALKTDALCMTALNQNGHALMFIPDERKSIEFCLAAVQQNGEILRLVPPHLQTHEVCLAAVRQNGEALRHVPKKRVTKEICEAAVQQTHKAYEFIPKQIVLDLLKGDTPQQQASSGMPEPKKQVKTTSLVCKTSKGVPMMPRGFAYSAEPLKAALAEYDRTAPEREKLWESIKNNDDVHRAEQADQQALLMVQEAFYQLTKDRNSLKNCRLVSIKYIREVIDFVNSELAERPQNEKSKNTYPGYTEISEGCWCANRTVFIPSLSVGKLNALIKKTTGGEREVEILKDYKWVLLYDQQTAEEKGFYVKYLSDNGGTPVLKNKFWLTDINSQIKKFGGDPQDLTNNPMVMDQKEVRQQNRVAKKESSPSM